MAYKAGNLISDVVTVLGPALYDNAARPTVTFQHIKNIPNAQSVVITAPGYIVDVVSVALNVATYRVGAPTNAHTHVFAGNALATHQHAVTGVTFTGNVMATHQHDITTVAAAGGGVALTEPAATGPFESAGGGATNANVVDAATAGTPAGTIGGNSDAITAGTPAGTNAVNVAAVGDEIPNATVLSGVTFLCQAYGYSSNSRARA